MKRIYLIMVTIAIAMVSCDSKYEDDKYGGNGGNGGGDNENYDGKIAGHGYVDLGLPSELKWATCNVGANKPEDYGDYFAWGETSPKAEYDYDNCVTVRLSKSELQSQGYIDGSGRLTSQHDAARANWGGSWRMPMKSDYASDSLIH